MDQRMEERRRESDRPAVYVYLFALLYFLAGCYASMEIALYAIPITTSPGQDGHVMQFAYRYALMGVCIALFTVIGLLIARVIIRHLPPPRN